jgi:citrate lyase subunit beta/citryl-CoA lyase
MRSRRSCLVVPASSEKMIAKARQLPADEVVLDLEDAVTPARKDDARTEAVAALAQDGFAATAIAVRINPPRTPWAHQDLIALGSAEGRPDTVVVPKVESAADLAFVDRLLDGVERAAGHVAPLHIQALIETARGLQQVDEIVRASARLEAVILGYADLGASLGRSHEGARELDLWLAVQDTLLTAARAADLQAIDGPLLSIDDEDGLRAASERAARLGFDGKWAIHPSQLPAITAAFTPDPAEIQRARAVLAALEQADADDLGAVALDGEMLDEAVRLAAQRTLARAGETR